MKKKMFKFVVILMSVCIMFVVCTSPASAVSYNRTMDIYVYGERSFGQVTLYPSMANASTYCEFEQAGKQVYVAHKFYDSNMNGYYIYSDEYWGTFQYNNDTLLINTTGSQNIVYMNEYAESKHRVKVGPCDWTYEDPYSDSISLYVN